ncbi:hypothetical protein [Tengunoibacter tsumagoiensis]|uniref:Uncharacterized protein n=1 Tax=Tengunoibacter tsumagoiensis TaxID=2014871 RepID=A0A401ZWA1_9CHLR|nr:hypothetical protein [Tengunoibacter tsumagoiensis]GCE11050.1 hypothetical protein KTT_09090 [Tengunoibacter tsumagoiensis]
MQAKWTEKLSALLAAGVLITAVAIVVGPALSHALPASAHVVLRNTTPANTAVTTYHNDIMRTGQNLNETILNTSNVNKQLFGQRVSYPVDGVVTAQPLFVPDVTINGNLYNVVYVATENDSVYAFDADQARATAPLWHTSFISLPLRTTAISNNLYFKYPYKDLFPQVGITGTPVIDLHTGTLYVVAMTVHAGHYEQHLHALDITTGRDKSGSPLLIQAKVPGTGYDSVDGMISFNPKTANQRPALLFVNGVIYISWGAFGDTDPYHGWVMGYTYNGRGFRQVKAGVYSDTANGQEAGIWMSGSGPAADKQGNIYFTTGNGSFDIDKKGPDTGDSFVKLSTQNGLKRADYFAPFNQSCMDGRDGDLGSGGVLLLPDQSGKNPHLLFGAAKEGRLYLINRDHMGGFAVDPHLACNTDEETRVDIDHVVQELPPGTTESVYGTAGYWQGTAKSGPILYVGSFNGPLKAFPLKNGLLDAKNSTITGAKANFSGETPTITSNGSRPGTGIVWVISPSVCGYPGCLPKGPGTLRAYDATDLTHELYNSGENGKRDLLDSYTKFSVPTVANGEVFVGTRGALTIFGLFNAPTSSGVMTSTDMQSEKQPVHYSGQWVMVKNAASELGLYNNSYSTSVSKGASFSCTFVGMQMTLYGLLGPKNGLATISLDGSPPVKIDFYANHVVGDQPVWSSPWLAKQKHTVVLTVIGQKAVKSKGMRVSLDRIAITA